MVWSTSFHRFVHGHPERCRLVTTGTLHSSARGVQCEECDGIFLPYHHPLREGEGNDDGKLALVVVGDVIARPYVALIARGKETEMVILLSIPETSH